MTSGCGTSPPLVGIGPFQIGLRDNGRTAVTGTRDVNHRGVVLAYDAIQTDIDQVLAWRSSPMTGQARLDVRGAQRLPQQRIFLEIDLPDGEVVRGAPVRVYELEFLTY
jgi:hypothetical protein